MAKNTVSRISSAFATGGGGVNFEQNIQALFLLSLLVDGFCPVINEPTKRVCFQAKHLGFAIDDLAVFTYRGTSEGKLLCQIKHTISISANDSVFQEVINAAWSDFNKDEFDRKKDKIVFATANITVQSQKALRYLNAQACASADEVEFADRIRQAHFSSNNSRTVLDTIKKCINRANSSMDPLDHEIWEFCCSFVLIVFDLDYAESVNRTLATMLIKANCNDDPYLVWSRLVDYSARCNQSAASIDINNIDAGIKCFFTHKDKEIFLAQPNPLEVIDTFVPALTLIGSWKEDNAFDRSIIENISGSKYEEYELKARSMLSNHPEYLRLENGVWKVLHKERLIEQCAGLFFDDIIDRLFLNAKEVFKQLNRGLEGDTSYFIPKSEMYENSFELRNSLSESMCLIKYSIERLTNCNATKIENHIYSFIRGLFHDCRWIIWASLKDCINNIAELEPTVFLQELEWNIINNSKEIIKLFPKQGSDIFCQDNHICVLLWVLETLSWSPTLLVPSVRCLGLLATLPYDKTNWSNTPINSIISILLPWHPQTLAESEKRKNALLSLRRDNPEVFWTILVKLLPNQTTTTSDNPRPRFLPVNIPEDIRVLTNDMLTQYKTNLSLAIEFAGVDGDKLSVLSKEIKYMDAATLTVFLDHIDGISFSDDKEKAFNLWLKLSEQMSENGIKGSTPILENTERIEKILLSIEPQDIRIKYRELYLRNNYRHQNEDYTIFWERLEKSKAEAILELFQRYGSKEVESFGKAVKNTYDVGFKLGAESSPEMMASIILDFCEGQIERKFFAYCLNGFFNHLKAEGLLLLLNGYDEAFISDVLSMIPFSTELLKVINALLQNDTIYWQKASLAYGYQYEDASILQLIYTKLSECRRYVTAVNTIGHSEYSNAIDASALCNLLKLAGTEESIGDEKLDIYAAQRIIALLQKQNKISIEQISDIEFLYLPILDDSSEIQAKALKTRLSNEPDYFCSMIELFYKRHSDPESSKELDKGLNDRLFSILFQFNIVPGTDSNGVFKQAHFKEWFNTVKDWSIKNDRYAVTMHTVGSGLSYSNPGGRSLPPDGIMIELNKPGNDYLREGYRIGMINQRGIHTVDPQGKPELEISGRFAEIANKAEEMGYSRYSEVLRELSAYYKREAMHNIKIHSAWNTKND